MSKDSKASRVVFVGNIPYDGTEQQLIDIFQEVGEVVTFRLVTDRETGKPKGFGFCEFKDPMTAMSAMRNLNGYELSGRALRVDFAENEKAKDRGDRDRDRGGRGSSAGMRRERMGWREDEMGRGPGREGHGGVHGPRGGVLGDRPGPGMNHPPPADVPNPQEAMDKVAETLTEFSQPVLLDHLAQIKQLAIQNSVEARLLLMHNPQLTYAMLQSLKLLGIKPVPPFPGPAGPAGAPAPAAPPAGLGVPAFPPVPGMHAGAPPAPVAGPGPVMGLGPGGGAPPLPGSASAPSAPGTGVNPILGQLASLGAAAGVQMDPGMAGGPVPGDLKEQTGDLLRQVLALTPQQVQALPPEYQEQIRNLRGQVGGV